MSEENVEIVRSMYEAINRDDWDAAFEAVAPDFELVPPDGYRLGAADCSPLDVCDRKLVRCEVVPEREKALEAAGLRE
jgi:hypothetical protein